jgi:hypothetical protein
MTRRLPDQCVSRSGWLGPPVLWLPIASHLLRSSCSPLPDAVPPPRSCLSTRDHPRRGSAQSAPLSDDVEGYQRSPGEKHPEAENHCFQPVRSDRIAVTGPPCALSLRPEGVAASAIPRSSRLHSRRQAHLGSLKPGAGQIDVPAVRDPFRIRHHCTVRTIPTR